jgi:hypothetical protein
MRPLRKEAIVRKVAALLFLWLSFLPSAFAKKTERPPLSAKIMEAGTAYIDCVCPRALGAAQTRATEQMRTWGRFQLVESAKAADLVFLFSGNPYLGDYLTRDGPDKRPVFIESTIMTVIDAKTGEELWTDSRRWGSWRVDGATKDLVAEFQNLMASQIKRWTLNDLTMCSVTPTYALFAHVTAEEAMRDPSVARLADKPRRLRADAPKAPGFCRSAELLIGADNKIIGFEVFATRADDLDIDEILQHADRFNFNGGKYANGDQVFFSAESKDKKMLIEFDVQGHRSMLSRVTYYY